MRVRARVTVTDTGLAALKARLASIPKVTVGVHHAEGDVPYVQPTGRPVAASAPQTILQIATTNEFGSDDGRIPSRPFLRGWFDDQVGYYAAELKNIGMRIIKGAAPAKEFQVFGRYLTAEVKRGIDDQAFGAFVPNAPLTIRLKGSADPLVDTGQLYRAITFKVIDRKQKVP